MAGGGRTVQAALTVVTVDVAVYWTVLALTARGVVPGAPLIEVGGGLITVA